MMHAAELYICLALAEREREGEKERSAESSDMPLCKLFAMPFIKSSAGAHLHCTQSQKSAYASFTSGGARAFRLALNALINI